MTKHISTCSNPQIVRNKFTNELVTVACGRCDGCQNLHAYRWKLRLEQEMTCHPYCFFLTLKYSDDNIPRYTMSDYYDCNEIVSNREDIEHDRCMPITFDELYKQLGSTGREIDYVQSRLSHPLGLPHGNVADLQKFFKRLNRHIYYHYTNAYKNFIYWIVCEYGPTTFRPHYHALLYIDNKQVADNIENILAQTWTLGSWSCSSVNSQCAASSYVAQYLNCFSNLPKIYTKFRSLRPFFLCSRKTIIGSNIALAEDLQQIFFGASPRRSVPDWRSHRYLDVPLLPSIEDRLFPRLARYSSLSDIDRVTLYGIHEKSNTNNFEKFETWCKYQTTRVYPQDWQKSVIYSYVMCLTYGGRFDLPKSKSALYRFYCIVRRVSKNAASFGISVREYALNILRYYERKDYYNLTQFYEFQTEYASLHPLPDLIHCYPEFYYRFSNGGDIPYLHYVQDSFLCDFFPSFDNTFDIRSQVLHQRYIREKNTKTHKKNEYFEKKLKFKDYQLYQIIKNYSE